MNRALSGIRQPYSLMKRYAETRGTFFLVAWAHRVSGILLVVLVGALCVFDVPVPYKGSAALSIVALLLAIPLAFHAFNGVRLILYEAYGRRDDHNMLGWVIALTSLYVLLLTLLIASGEQGVAPFFFWAIATAGGVVAACALRIRLKGLRHSSLWALQRISGGLLLFLGLAMAIYIHLTPLPYPDSALLGRGFQEGCVRGVYLLALISALGHGGYGIWAIIGDYVGSKRARVGSGVLVAVMIVLLVWSGASRIINSF